MVHLFLDRQGTEIKYPFVDPAECHSLGNSCYPCTHTSMSSYLHLFDMDITGAARIVLWQDDCCPGLHLHIYH
ncbi:hypothetical protein XELAEV_18047196mg [Xenopus laevis]|uniref:Uncharacterized protein n=1 Tax=Xenopus laevis TaxID=8355 RepID=A0A974H1A1_XENLA|nr:hypothetical protein XELAEV_18047196mg [Xenopus laevis]